MLKNFVNRSKKGFTLIEVLIVVAIIAILAAITIPTVASQLEKAREATDTANIRSAYAQLMLDFMDKGDAATLTKDVPKAQTDTAWTTTPTIADLEVVAPGTNGWTLTLDPTTGEVSIAAKS